MNVIIERKHTDGITFDNRNNGALIRAMRQQHPEVKMQKENDGFCIDNNGDHYDFDNSDEKGYSRKSFDQLKSKEIKQISIRLEKNNIR